MEDQIIQLLTDTQATDESTRRHAEDRLQQLYGDKRFPRHLISIASKTHSPVNVRQSALICLKNYVLSTWSPNFDEFKGDVLLGPSDKEEIRQAVLEIAIGDNIERKVTSSASFIVSKIATVDYPEEWSELLPILLHVIPTGSEDQVRGALKVLAELVDDCLNEHQFFVVARDLVKLLFDVAADEKRSSVIRALALSAFRPCFDTLEAIMEKHKNEVRQFAEEILHTWISLLVQILRLRSSAQGLEGGDNSKVQLPHDFAGIVALKLQAVKILMRIRALFPSILASQSPLLFSTTWEELASLPHMYETLYIENDYHGDVEGMDGLPYSLELLIIEEIDFMQACLRAQTVRKELQNQSKIQSTDDSSWLTQIVKLAIKYAQITSEEEALWNIDVNVFLSEESSVTANYATRTASGDLITALGESFQKLTIEGLLSCTRSIYSTSQSWKEKEAALYLLNHLLVDFQDLSKSIALEDAEAFVDFIRFAIHQENTFLKARGFLVAGTLVRASAGALQRMVQSLAEATLGGITSDSADIVKVSCIKSLQNYIITAPQDIQAELQASILSALSEYLNSQDLTQFGDSEDLLITLVETIRDAILMDARICLETNALDLLFSIASHGSGNFQIVMLVSETFEDAARSISTLGIDAYTVLCEKVLPTLSGAFDLGLIADQSSLTNLAAELVSVLANMGSEPLPRGFVASVMPRLSRLLLESEEEELLKAATAAVKHIVTHDHNQLFEWQDSNGRGGLEVVLMIIGRLLMPSMDDNAASEVGGLAAEAVEKAGSERLGPFLMQLLQAVAVRVATATADQLIQSLTMVFARLSLHSAREVIDFLAQVEVGQDSGLQVVMSKWLENSINFAGYDAIRRNVMALSKLYELQDPRLDTVMVKGDLIPSDSSQIMTRSRAKQNPDQFTVVSANFKILKVLVEELLVPSARENSTDDAALAELLQDDEQEDNDEWDDEGDTLDLGLGVTKKELMGYAEGGPTDHHQSDDETQVYLLSFFRQQASKPEFNDLFNRLTTQQQEKLRSMAT